MASRSSVHNAQRYLGLELAGAKNQKTALAALEFYPQEQKIFLLDIFEKIMKHEDQTSDEALLDLVAEFKPITAELTTRVPMGVNVPLDLPPCIGCTRKTCPLPQKCTVPTVKWMRETAKKAQKKKEFTPYTQRPVELWIRHHVLPELPAAHAFEIDETLGGNKGPLTARMHFLKRHLHGIRLLETWPKLTISVLGFELGLSKRTLSSYRKLEEGAYAREEILETLVHQKGVFIYERDIQKLSHSLACFDAFICAYTALLADTHQCAKTPKASLGSWVHYPRLC